MSDLRLLRLVLPAVLAACAVAVPPAALAAAGAPSVTCQDLNVTEPKVTRAACMAWLRDPGLTPAQKASAYGNLAWAYKDMGDLQSAWRQADLSTAASPTEPTGYEVRAAVFHMVRRTPEARVQIDKALQLGPTYRGHLIGARILGELGDFDAAIAHDDAAIALQPRRTPAYVNRGNNHWSKRDYAAALADYRLAEAIEPKSTVITFNIANVLLLLKRDDEALISLEQTLRVNPGHAGAIKLRGYVHRRAGRFDASLADYETAARLTPRDADAVGAVALTQSFLGRHDAAMATVEKARRIDPQSADVMDARCWIRAVQGRDPALAVADCEAAVKMGPDNAEYRADLAFARLKAGQVAAAALDAEAAVAVDPKDADAIFMRGYVRTAQGRQQDAHADLIAALKLDPTVMSRNARLGLKYE